MTTHPEDAMTRERALEEALKPFADYYNGENRDDSRLLLPLHYYRNAARALVSAQQEPAPAADAEEVAWLVEFKPSVCGAPSFYFIVDDPDSSMTTNANKALRFARKQDADQFITREGWTEAFASEHMWSRAAANTKPTEKGRVR